ncbi:hypothetical protein PoMZ_10027 [Pyricularia oryzae]|uniref:Secreted protein n=1 Tax=Pyricularia oryzae TaxID=318829 RepID=A0A4P7MYV1_PYROR|nr:hypothetical protein PoMZ_10027 [Pyricularia oryzae]
MFGLRLLIKWLMFGGVIFPVVSFRKSCQTQRVLASYISLKSDGTMLHIETVYATTPLRHAPLRATAPYPTTPSYFVAVHA